MTKLKKLLVIILTCLFVLFGAWWLYLFYSYSGTMPKSPQPDVGRVYALNNHGSIVYLTKEEEQRLTYLAILAFFCGIVGSALNIRFNLYPDPLKGLSAEQRYKILHGPHSDYKKVRETYRRKE